MQENEWWGRRCRASCHFGDELVSLGPEVFILAMSWQLDPKDPGGPPSNPQKGQLQGLYLPIVLVEGE